MKFISEVYDEETNEYVLTYDASPEEKEKLDKYCEEHNTTPDKIVSDFLDWSVNNPKEFAKWVKENRDDKLPTGVLGKPVLKMGDKAGFYIKPYKAEEEMFFIGTVEIVDSHGTFEQNEEPSYDIMVQDFNGNGPTLVKHVRESECYKIAD